MTTFNTIIVHGGAGSAPSQGEEEEKREGLREAAWTGKKILRASGSALDAVERAVATMEDNKVFNCGTGSVLNYDGQVEMDASIMAEDGRCGAVGCIKNVKNPISVARKVMEETDHVLLCGEGAEAFARLVGFKYYDPVTKDRLTNWTLKKERFVDSLNNQVPMDDFPYWTRLREFFLKYKAGASDKRFSTVGAVAIDSKGSLAAATSTGGISFKLPGRVGDSAIIGAGNYAGSCGGVSATGHGEAIIKLSFARLVEGLMGNLAPMKAAARALEIADSYGCKCGIICISKKGELGYGFNTESMLFDYA